MHGTYNPFWLTIFSRLSPHVLFNGVASVHRCVASYTYRKMLGVSSKLMRLCFNNCGGRGRCHRGAAAVVGTDIYILGGVTNDMKPTRVVTKYVGLLVTKSDQLFSRGVSLTAS